MNTLAAVSCVLLSLAAGELPPIQHIECLKAATPIAIDGDLEDAAWKEAKAVTDFRLWGAPDQKPAGTTSVRFCYDAQYLYAAFECVDPDIYALYEGRDDCHWESDAVELFLKPAEECPIYYEFQVAPNNAVFDAQMVNTGSGGYKRWAKAWNCDLKSAVTVRGTVDEWRDRDEGYSVELAIPLDALSDGIDEKDLAGQTWQFAAVRVELSVTLKKEERSSTSNSPAGDIHGDTNEPGRYFTLAFK